MVKKFIFASVAFGFLLASCKSGPTENPKQIGNRERLDIYHQQKKVKWFEGAIASFLFWEQTSI